MYVLRVPTVGTLTLGVMPQMIEYKDMLIRIHSSNANKLEYSRNGGKTWMQLYGGRLTIGTFKDIMVQGKELLASTSNGLYYSTDGRT